MTWHKSESDVYPVLIDTESSPTTVYIRQNVEEETRHNEQSGDRTVFVYDEATMTKLEYESYLREKNQADIEYLYMMGGYDYE